MEFYFSDFGSSISLLYHFNVLGYFLATGGTSCTEACKSKGLTCDVDSILSIATDLSTCNETIQKLGKTAASQGTFPDDNSGCTYHPNGNGWYQLMNNGYPTTCDVKNSDATRQRVCSCKGKAACIPILAGHTP